MNGLLLWLRIHVRGGLLVLLVLAVVAELTVGRFAVQIAWAPLQTVHVGLFLPVLTCGIAVLFLHSGVFRFRIHVPSCMVADAVGVGGRGFCGGGPSGVLGS